MGATTNVTTVHYGTTWDDSTLLEEVKQKGFKREPTEYKLKRKNGEYVWVETEASIIYRNGEPYAVQGVARDITERKLTEEAL